MKQTDLYCYNLTPWQLNWCLEEERKKNFQKWLHVEGIRPGDRYEGPIVMMYFDKDGSIHSIALGLNSTARRIHLRDGVIISDTGEDVFTQTEIKQRPGRNGSSLRGPRMGRAGACGHHPQSDAAAARNPAQR